MCDLRKLAVIFGVVFLIVGLSGYVPFLMKSGSLLGVFEFSHMHSIVLVVSGVIALLAARDAGHARWFFKIFGVLFTAAAVVGFMRSGDLYFMHTNMADNGLHLVIGLLALFFGFWCKKAA
jgi:hypothetical protein